MSVIIYMLMLPIHIYHILSDRYCPIGFVNVVNVTQIYCLLHELLYLHNIQNLSGIYSKPLNYILYALLWVIFTEEKVFSSTAENSISWRQDSSLVAWLTQSPKGIPLRPIHFLGAPICSDPNCSNSWDIDNANVQPIRAASKKKDKYVKVLV